MQPTRNRSLAGSSENARLVDRNGKATLPAAAADCTKNERRLDR
jgi:hypothetical protein